MLLSYIKRGTYNALVYAFSSLFSRFINFMFLSQFLSVLTLEELGIWDFYQSITTFGVLLASSIANISLTRFYFYYSDDLVKQKQAMGNAFLCVLINTFLVPIVVFFGFKIFQYDINCDAYLFITVLNIAASCIFSFMLGFYRTKEKRLIYIFLSVTQNTICLVLTLFSLRFGYGVKSFLYANFISLLISVPMFFKHFSTHVAFSFAIFKNQLIYTLPIVLYSVLYGLFFFIDRMIITRFLGYEVLGTYSLLWRFGVIYQFFTIALFDSYVLAIFDAQKQKNGNMLISKIMSYFFFVIVLGSLVSCFFSYYAITIMFPEKYLYLIYYIPLFFLSIMFLEIYRLIQVLFGLSQKTLYCPLFVGVMLLLQLFFDSSLVNFGLAGVLIGNLFVFIFATIAAYFLGTFLYNDGVVEVLRTVKLLLFYIFLSGLFQVCMVCNIPIFLFLLFAIVLIPIVFFRFNVIQVEERQWLFSKFKGLYSFF